MSTHTPQQEGEEISQKVVMSYICGKNVTSAQMLEAYLFGVGTVLRLERV